MSFNRSNNKIKSIFQTLAALGIILFFMISCEETSSEFDYEEYPVVEAFLIPGQPVDRVHVFKINDFVDSITSNLGIGGLSIRLVVDSIEYMLTEKQDSTGYYCYPGDDLEILEGQHCELFFDYRGNTISSETYIPDKPANLELSKTSIYVFAGGFGSTMDDPIEVIWDNPGDNFYYMVAENIEDDPIPINEFFEDQPSSFGTSPSTTNLINIEPRQIRFYGTYRLVIFRVNPEFAELSLYTTTNTINLTEPYTNIINGKGIFTAFDSDTAYFEASSR